MMTKKLTAEEIAEKRMLLEQRMADLRDTKTRSIVKQIRIKYPRLDDEIALINDAITAIAESNGIVLPQKYADYQEIRNNAKAKANAAENGTTE